MLAPDIERLIASARTLRSGAAVAQAPLRGKNLGLLCAAAQGPDALLFCRAAAGLGANVACISHGLSASSTPEQVALTARLLGRLYDAIECQDLAPEIVSRLRNHSGIPVFDGIACTTHPSAAVAARLGGEASADDRRRLVVQALLLSALT